MKFRYVIVKLSLEIAGWGIACEISLIWMSLHLTDGQSTLVQVMTGAIRQQAITRASVDPDLCRHMASLGHNELKGVHDVRNKLATGRLYAVLLITGPTDFSSRNDTTLC